MSESNANTMRRVRERVNEFFRRPYGVGAPVNIYMFAPSRLIRHLGTALRQPTYFMRRITVMLNQLRHPDEPWLTAEAVAAIKGHLSADMRVFEWGSGKSTLWLARRARQVVSVEHDAAWHARVRAMLAASDVRNAELRSAYGGAYAAQIAEFPDAFFHFVLIDGDDRNGCIRAAADKVAPGGWIVVDNADGGWDYSPLAAFGRTITHNGVWQTDIFVKPKRPGA